MWVAHSSGNANSSNTHTQTHTHLTVVCVAEETGSSQFSSFSIFIKIFVLPFLSAIALVRFSFLVAGRIDIQISMYIIIRIEEINAK